MGRTPAPATQGALQGGFNAPHLRDGCVLRLLACANLLSKRATALKSCCGATTRGRHRVRRSALGDATVLASQPGRRWLPGAVEATDCPAVARPLRARASRQQQSQHQVHRGPRYAGDVPCPRAGPMPVVRSAATTLDACSYPGFLKRGPATDDLGISR
jgi:hypothetical protein